MRLTNQGKLILASIEASGDISAATINGISDVNLKESFVPINTTDVLSKIANLPITEWQYKGSADRHIGPMAQDFYAAFGLGQGETTIATVDADGVALVAIQALNEKVELENANLKEENEDLKNQFSNLTKRLEKIEKLLLEKEQRNLRSLDSY